MSLLDDAQIYSIGMTATVSNADRIDAVSDRSNWVLQYLDWSNAGVWVEFATHDPGQEQKRFSQLARQL